MSRITIIGSGTVGETTGRLFRDLGHEVEFRDSDAKRVSELAESGLRALTIDASPVADTDFFFICVPTPNRNGRPDLSYLQSALELAARSIAAQSTFSVVVVRSTVPVGTVYEVALPLIEHVSKKQLGADFGICSNPEYIRAESAQEDSKTPRAIILGSEDPRSAHAMERLYKPLGTSIYHLSTKEAEMHKYAHNLLNATKISFFNEQRIVCNALGVDADAIFPLIVLTAEASWNPLYGTKNKGPFQGSCLPKDLEGFIGWIEDRLKLQPHLLRAVKAVNDALEKK